MVGLDQVRPGISNFGCQGNEDSLDHCSYDRYPVCTMDEQVAAVTCFQNGQ